MTKNRIFFKDNPYPLGHKIVEFVWSGHLDENGQLWFDLHLKTEKYYAEDPTHFDENDEDDNDDEDLSEWDAKNSWGNYHACTMSSTYWGSNGILIDVSKGKLDFAYLGNLQLTADKMPTNHIMPPEMEWDDLAFNIYLLGHDACASHQIDISQTGKNCFDLRWKGKIALAYKGEDEFKYSFSANIDCVKFDGFDYPQTLSQEAVREQFSKFIANCDDFEFVDLNPKSNKREYKFALT